MITPKKTCLRAKYSLRRSIGTSAGSATINADNTYAPIGTKSIAINVANVHVRRPRQPNRDHQTCMSISSSVTIHTTEGQYHITASRRWTRRTAPANSVVIAKPITIEIRTEMCSNAVTQGLCHRQGLQRKSYDETASGGDRRFWRIGLLFPHRRSA